MNRRQIVSNIISSFIALLISTGINFFLTPYIVQNVGVEANAFLPIASNFVSYVSIFSTTFTSMGGRYIAVELEKGHKKTANEYFSTLFYVSILLATISSFVFIYIIVNLTKYLNIPEQLIKDVTVVFCLSFSSAVFNILFCVFNLASFCRNRLELKSIVSICSTVIRLIVICVLFKLFPAHLYFVGIANFIANIIEIFMNICASKYLLKDFTINIYHFKICCIKSLFCSGIWNSVNQLSSILMSGLDLLFANLYLGPTLAGYLGTSKLFPGIIYTLVFVIISSFAPQYIFDYTKYCVSSKGEKELYETMDYSAKIVSFFASIPVGCFIVYSFSFFSLWIPELDARTLQILSTMVLIGDAISYPIKVFDNLFSAANKVMWPALTTLLCGLINCVSMYILLVKTDLGVYAIAGTSVVLLAIKELLFKVPYLSKIIKKPPKKLYRYIIKYYVGVFATIVISRIIIYSSPVNSWGNLVIDVLLTITVAVILNIFCIFTKQERIRFSLQIKRKFTIKD